MNPQDPADPDRGRRSPTGTEDRVRVVLVVGSLTACLITLLFFVMFFVMFLVHAVLPRRTRLS